MRTWQRVRTSRAWWTLSLAAASAWIGVRHALCYGLLAAHTHWITYRRFLPAKPPIPVG